jgi:hypothetical protein
MAVLIDLAFFVGGAANGAFLGFEVPKGDVAVFDHSPRSGRLGLALAGVAVTSTLAVALWRRRQRSGQL